MTIQDLLNTRPTEAIVEAFMASICTNKVDIDKTRLSYTRILEQFKCCSITAQNEVMLGAEYIDIFDGTVEDHFEVSLYKIDEIRKWKANGMVCNDREESMPRDGMELAERFPDLPHSYAYEFTPWEEVLGIQVYLPNVERYGVDRFLAAVIMEMTFFGIDEDAKQQEMAELLRRVKEAEEWLKLPPEEQEGKFFTLEEVREHLGLEPESEDQKRQRQEDGIKEVYYNLRQSYATLMEYANSLGDSADNHT